MGLLDFIKALSPGMSHDEKALLNFIEKMREKKRREEKLSREEEAALEKALEFLKINKED